MQLTILPCLFAIFATGCYRVASLEFQKLHGAWSDFVLFCRGLVGFLQSFQVQQTACKTKVGAAPESCAQMNLTRSGCAWEPCLPACYQACQAACQAGLLEWLARTTGNNLAPYRFRNSAFCLAQSNFDDSANFSQLFNLFFLLTRQHQRLLVSPFHQDRRRPSLKMVNTTQCRPFSKTKC